MEKPNPTDGLPKPARLPYRNGLIVVILFAVLILSAFQVSQFMHKSPPATDQTKGTTSAQNVYIGYKDVIYKLSGSHGSIIWKHALKQPHTPDRQIGSSLQIYLTHDIVYATMEYAVYALRTSDGQELWHNFPTPTTAQLAQGIGSVMSLLIDQNLLYIQTARGDMIALDATTGALKWQRNLIPNGGNLAAIQGTLYLQEYTSQGGSLLFAIDGQTGKERWHLSREMWGNTGQTAAYVNDRIVYSPGNPLYALDAQTGKQLWEKRLPNRAMYLDNLKIIGSRLYTNTQVVNDLVGGEIDPPANHLSIAFDPKTGKQFWRSSVGYQMLLPSSANDTVFLRSYMPVKNQYHLQVLNAQTGTLRWQTMLTTLSCASDTICSEPLVQPVSTQLYILDDTQPKALQVFNLQSGSLQTKQPLSVPTNIGIVPDALANGFIYGRSWQHQGGDYVSGSNNTSWHIVIYAIRISDGSLTWRYEIGSLKEYREPISDLLSGP